MPDPFELFGRMFLAGFKITGYFFVFLIQVMWHTAYRQIDKIGDDFGYLDRGVTDAFADIFK